MKKILALLLAALMALSMTAALADTTPANDGPIDITYAATDTLTINKVVVVDNELDKIWVRFPTFTYKYELTIPTAEQINGAYVEDSDQHKVAIEPGVSGGAAFKDNVDTVTISPFNMRLNKNGQEAAIGQLSINIAAAPHGHPGVFRYKLSDVTTNAQLAAMGITRGADKITNYMLDVYVGWDDATSENRQLVLRGYVLVATTAGTPGTDGQPGTPGTPATTETVVTPGVGKASGDEDVVIIPGTEGTPDTEGTDPTEGKSEYGKLDPTTPADDKTNDFFHTFNVTLNKKVTGAGDTEHEFPFAVAITDNMSLTYLAKETDDDEQDVHKLTLGSAANFTLNDGDTLNLYGLSALAKVGYTETIDIESTYEVTMTDKAKKELAKDTTVDKDESLVLTPAAITNYDKDNIKAEVALNDMEEVTCTNNLPDISITGVALRFAPYIAMLAAGIVLVLISRRRKESKDEQ